MENIGSPCGVVVGGIADLLLIDAEDILSMPETSNDYIITSEITIKSGATWGRIAVKVNTSAIEEVGTVTDQGIRYDFKINLSSVKISPEVQLWKKNNAYKTFVGVLKDFHNQCFVIGSKDYPLQLPKTKAAFGTSGKSVNGTEFQFVGTGPNPIVGYLMFEVVPDENRRIFDSTFDLTFE